MNKSYVYDGLGAMPALLWADDVAAVLHQDAEEILRVRRAVAAIENHHDRHLVEKALAGAVADLTEAMIMHGKRSHMWPDGLTVEIYAPERPGQHQTLPPTARVFKAG
jgi:hypothetical protein